MFRPVRAAPILLTVLLGMTPLSLFGQNFAARFIGVTGGATLSDMSAPGISTNTRWGGTAGLIVGVRTHSFTIVAVEPAWAQKGGDGVKMDYLDVPVTFGGVGRLNESWRAHGYVGLGVNFKLGCSSEVSALNCADAESTEWSLPLGVRFTQVSPGGTFYSFDIRYSIPLSDAFDFAAAANRTWFFRMIVGRGGR